MAGHKRCRNRLVQSLFAVGCLFVPARSHAQQQSLFELVEQFKAAKVFWQQFEVAKRIVELHDLSVLPLLKPWLADDDRHLRGNAAFVFASLGDESGFDVIAAMLSDHSDRPEGQGIGFGRFSVQAQIGANRCYAVHLMGELKEERAIVVLEPLLSDPSVNYKVAWALGQIGGKRAIELLVVALHDKSSDVRVIAIDSLQKPNAKEALPSLRLLLDDHEKSHFGDLVSVSDAARAAIAKLEAIP